LTTPGLIFDYITLFNLPGKAASGFPIIIFKLSAMPGSHHFFLRNYLIKLRNGRRYVYGARPALRIEG